MTKTKVTAGLLAIAALFTVSSCINVDPTLGSKYVPSDQDLSMNVVEFDLPLEMRMCDSLQTAMSSSIMVGSVHSDLFGTFTSEAAFTITPSDTTIKWGPDPVFKEMYLRLPLSKTKSVSEGQEHILQNIHLYQLNTVLDSLKIFSNSLTSDDYGPNPVSLENSVYSGGDELIIYLSEEFAKPLFDIPEDELDSAEVFMEKFKGLYIKSDLPVEGIDGGRLNSFSLSDAYFFLTFNSTNWKGVKRDTTVTFSPGIYYAVNIYNNESAPLSETNPEESIYLESLGGVTPFISGTTIHKMVTDWAESEEIDLKNTIITKASLILPFEYEGVGSLDYFPANIYPCRKVLYTDSLYNYYSPIDEVNDGTFSLGNIDKSLLLYKPDCCLYLQDLLRKKPEEIDVYDDLWLMSITGYTTSSSSYSYYSYYYGSSSSTTVYYVTMDEYYQARLNGTKSERSPKLRISYTVLK